jgi:uncharacterized membrane protein YphA (DoxX/SURF4 family)
MLSLTRDDRTVARHDLLLPGRILYAIAVAGFGVVCLVYLDFVNSLQPVPASVPGYRVLAVCTGIVLIAAGLGILFNVRTYVTTLVLAAFFVLWIVGLHIPSAFTNPSLLRSPWWIRTFESLALAGAALILAGLVRPAEGEQWIRAGRIAFGVSLPVFGVLHFVYPENVAGLVETAVVPLPAPLFWAYFTGAGHFAAGVAIASGKLARLAAILAGVMYASWALTLHLPRVLAPPPVRTPDFPAGYGGDRGEITSLFVCVGFWGAAWIVAGSLAKRDGGGLSRQGA